MKGLIIKDLYCLKKQFQTFAFIITGVMAVGLMFVLSVNYGNLRPAVSGMEEAGFDITMSVKIAVMFFMLLPLVCAGNIADSFADDKTASFYKVAASLPTTTGKRVMSKFVTAMLFLASGLIIDIAAAGVISCVSDIMVFSKCISLLVSISACVMIGMSLTNTVIYAGVPPLYSVYIPPLTAGIIFFAVKIKSIINALTSGDVSGMARFVNAVIKAFEEHPAAFAISAFAVAAVSWFVSTRLALRKRGVA
ncbi:MAG: hypothetical protein K6B52_07710 [Clostridiales bacterium]|nr:hypothetical protein [Clostridiales bacterium]